MRLEKQLKEAEEKHQNALIREAILKEVIVMEAKERAVAEFKESEEDKLATQDFEAGYDKGVEETTISGVNAIMSASSSLGRRTGSI